MDECFPNSDNMNHLFIPYLTEYEQGYNGGTKATKVVKVICQRCLKIKNV